MGHASLQQRNLWQGLVTLLAKVVASGLNPPKPMNDYQTARETYAALGVDTESALSTLARTAISIHCWQGDDVGGFETEGAQLAGGGIQATGNHPGKARTIDELRLDLDKALSLIPGRHRLNLHACYADLSGGRVDRDG